MKEGIGPVQARPMWAISGVLLVAAAVAGAWATYLWWLPCRGRMLVGTAFDPRFSDEGLGSACIDRMNEGTPFPLPTEAALSAPGLLHLSTLTTVAVAAACLVPAAFLHWPSTAKPGLVLVGLALLSIAALGVVSAFGGGEAIGSLAPMAVDILLVLGLVLIVKDRSLPRLPCVILAVTAMPFGLSGMILDYLVMIRWSEANWDSPPGSGYLPACLWLVCGTALLVITAAQRRADPARRTVSAERV